MQELCWGSKHGPQLCQGRRKEVEMVSGVERDVIVQAESTEWEGCPESTLKTLLFSDSHAIVSSTPNIVSGAVCSLRDHPMKLLSLHYGVTDGQAQLLQHLSQSWSRAGRISDFIPPASKSGFSFAPLTSASNVCWFTHWGGLMTPMAPSNGLSVSKTLPCNFVVPSYPDSGLGHMTC